MYDVYYYNQIDTEEDILFVEEVLNLIEKQKDTKEITLIKVCENKRSSRELLKIIKESSFNDYMLFDSVKNLGLNDLELKNALERLLAKGNIVIFKDSNIPIEKQMQREFNKNFLAGLLYSISIISSQKNLNVLKQPNIGRPSIQYPDNWEECYKLWKDKKISSKEFLNRVKLKRATFYNLLTEYRKTI